MAYSNPIYDDLSDNDVEMIEMTGHNQVAYAARSPEQFGLPFEENLRFTFVWKEKSFTERLFVKDILHPCIMQFLVQKEFQRTLLKEALNALNINLTVGNGNKIITLEYEGNLQSLDQVREFLKSTIKSQCQHFDYLRIRKDTELFGGVKTYLTTNTTGKKLINEESIGVFMENSSVFISGRKWEIAFLEGKFSIVKMPVKLSNSWTILEGLKIERHLEDSKIDVEIRVLDNGIFVVGTTKTVDLASRMIATFESRIRCKTVEFSKPCCKKLLKDKDGTVNEVVQGYFMKMLSTQKIENHIEFRNTEKESDLRVYGRDETTTNKAAEAIAKCVVHSILNLAEESTLRNGIEEEKRIKKLMEINRTDSFVEFVHTKDSFERLNILKQDNKISETLTIPESLFSLIEKYIKEDVLAEASRCNITCEIDSRERSLNLKGTKSDVKNFRKGFRRLYFIDSVKLEKTARTVLMQDAILSQIAEENRCCFSAKFEESTVVITAQNCTPLVTWISHCCPKKLTLMSGLMEDADLGVRIMLVTDSGFPLHEMDSDKIVKLFSGSTKIKKLPLGSTVPKSDGRSKIVAISYLETNTENRLHKTKLRQAFVEALKSAPKDQPKTAGLSISFAVQDFNVGEIVEASLNAVNDSNTTDMFFFCKKGDGLEVSAECIEDVLRRNIKKEFYRYCHCDITLKKGFHKIKYMAAIGTLETMVADVIVNTVSPKLDLSQGYLSKQILQHAGSSVQTECEKTYRSKGIKMGQLAITNSGNLISNGVEKIFHCALQSFGKDSFEENVKRMVKECLREMDKLGLRTIAFPAFGTGKLRYPVRDTAKAMFDAVEEYQYECLESCIDFVYFIIFKDDKGTCTVFKDEWARRELKSYPKVVDVKSQGTTATHTRLIATAGEQIHQVSLVVTVEEEIKLLPSNVVDVKFTKLPIEKGELELKSSSTGRDVLQVHINSYDVDCLKTAASVLFQYCCENTIADIAVCIEEERSVPTDVQVNVIFDAVSYNCVNKKTSRLRNIYIGVADEEVFESLEQKLNGAGNATSAVKQTYSWKQGQKKWKLLSKDSSYVKLQVVGKSQQSVATTIQDIQSYLQNISSRDQASPQSATKNEEGAVNLYEAGTTTKDVKVHIVSADVNQGIIKYLTLKNQLDDWKRKQSREFGLKFIDRPEGNLTVEGSLSALLNFEKCLEEEFTDDEDTKNMHRTTTDEENLASLSQSSVKSKYEDNHGATHKPLKVFGKESCPGTKNMQHNTTDEKNLGSLSQNSVKRKYEENHGATHKPFKGLAKESFSGTNNMQPKTTVEENLASLSQNSVKSKYEDNTDATHEPFKGFGKESSSDIVTKTMQCKTTVEENQLSLSQDSVKSKYKEHHDATYETFKGSGKESCPDTFEQIPNERATDSFGSKQIALADNAYCNWLSFSIGDLQIDLLEGDITQTTVDCMINSARKNLEFVDLAAIIARVAGNQYKEECQQSVKNFGGLKTGETRFTKAGNLPCKQVLHVVLPDLITVSREKQYEILQSMEDTFVKCLNDVSKEQFSSVSMPILGTGILQFPLGLWAHQFIRALNSFVKTHVRPTKIHVFVVEIYRDKIKKLADEINAILKRTLSVETKSSLNEVNVTESRLVVKNANVPVKVLHAEIHKISTDAVVSPEDRYFLGKGMIAQAFLNLGSDEYKKAHSQLNVDYMIPLVGTVKETKVSDKGLACKYILHTVVPRRNLYHCQNPGCLEQEIKKTVNNVLEKAVSLSCREVAFPLFGISENEDSYPTAIETCCMTMVEGILAFLESKKHTSISQIDLVSTDASVVNMFCSALEASRNRLTQ